MSVPGSANEDQSRPTSGPAAVMAYGVLFLASDEASLITGTELVIDGGFIAQ
jgi:NAD(P)-dependent dehydrogenase (short-subunit alcohol dehydrogenase family)